MLATYRKDYEGEFVLTKTVFKNGQKIQNREWMPNPIVNQHISGRAVVIGSDMDKSTFDYTRLPAHRGGLLGSKKIQTYGTSTLWKQMPFDFFVTTSIDNLLEISASEYVNNIIYTTTKFCMTNPGLFYLIPYSIVLDELALAIYLACFDGHTEVFLLGYNNDMPNHNKSWAEDISRVFNTYTNVTFYIVSPPSSWPESWKKHKNVKSMTVRNFVSFCDI
jgi:hypothetical protein